MPNNENLDLEQRAQAALERAREAAPSLSPDAAQKSEIPQAPQFRESPEPSGRVESLQNSAHGYDTGDYEVIPAPISAEEMAKRGAATYKEVSDQHAGEDDDSFQMITNGDATPTKAPTDEDELVILTSAAESQMKDIPQSDRASFIDGIMPEIKQYQKDLVLKYGYTPEEAATSASNRMKKKAGEYAEGYAKEHPDAVVITIDKSQEETLEFDDETKAKMQKARMIKLIAVESQELASIKVKPLNKDDTKMSYMRDICDSISRYSVPLLAKGDYAYFNGAQSAVLVNAVSSEDDDLMDILEKKATLLYRCFSSSVTQSKLKRDGKEMTYEEFCNWYKYDDIDLGVYAIITASTMEESESTYVCQNRDCRQTFNITYNNKMLLDLSGLSELYQDRVKTIDQHRSSYEFISNYIEECDMRERFKSPFSQNIFELANPSIAEVRNKLDKCMPYINEITAIDLVMFIYLGTIWLYDKSDDCYVQLDTNEDPVTAFDILCHMHQVDIELISKQLQAKQYAPAFKIHVKCPHCGRDTVDQLSTDAMIFLHARASLTEIQ